MSSLDQAFIKAYRRAPAAAQTAQAYEPAQPPVDSLANPYAGPASESSLGIQDAWYGAGLRYRVDDPHIAADPALLPPHMAMPPQAYADLGYISPHYAMPPHPPAAASGPHLAAASPVTLPDPESLKLTPPLALPSIFRGSDSPDPDAVEGATPAFSADWEVDHFAWPEVCERLLDVEATYFKHVGARLSEATAQHPQVLMIVGCRRGEGRTTLALCLARCAAQAGVKVALLDAHFNNPQLGTRLGIEIPCGWSEVLYGRAPLNAAAVVSVAEQLTLFPLTEVNSVDLEPGDERLLALLQEISTQFPLVILDAGPLGAEDRHPFAGADTCPVNAAIVVRDLRHTTEKKAQATAEHLERSGIPAVGIAENFVEATPSDAAPN